MSGQVAGILGAEIASLPGVGEARARSFADLGIATVADLVRHLPFRVEAEHGEDTIESHRASLEAMPAA